MNHRSQTLPRLLLSVLLLSVAGPTAPAASQDGKPGTATAFDALFVVETTFPHDKLGKDVQTARVQPGFLVDAEFGVTPLSGLLRSQGEALYMAGSRSKVQFSVVGADPSLDLAVIRLKSPPKAVPSPAEASASTSEPGPRRVGLAEDSDAEQPFDASHAVLRIDLLDSRKTSRVELASLLDPAGEDGPLVYPTREAGSLSGFPIVDAEDRLVGIWKWTWAEKDSVVPHLIPAGAVRALVARARTSPDTKTLERLASAPLLNFFVPVLNWSETKKPQHGVTQAKDLRSKLRCSYCDGRGTKPDEDVDGKGNRTRRDEPCPKCKQHLAVISERDLWERLRIFSTEITLVPPTAGLDSLANAVENGLKNALELNQAAILLSAYDGGKEELALANLVPGRAIAFTIHRDAWPTKDDTLWGENVRLVDVDDDSYPPLILRAPYARSTVGEGHVAWVTAVVAGPLTVNGETAVVLDRAIVVPVAAPNSFRAGR